MPFQQPTPTPIRQTHFRGKTYAFLVESVLARNPNGGLLRLDVSSGYDLTTSANETPQAHQTLPYVKQPDGGWLASSTVSLTATAGALLSGSITLLDPLGESLNLPISIDSALFIDNSEITFADTKLGDTSAMMLHVRQRGAVTPISLHLEPTHHFAIADARTAMVSVAKLTITPSFEGSNVILTYKPNRAGRHEARLVVTTPYDTQTVQLFGQTGGLLSRLQMPRFQLPKLPRLHLAMPAILHRGKLVGGLAAVVLAGVIWAGYQLLARTENKIDMAVIPQQPSEAYISLSTPINRPEKPIDNAPDPVESPSPEPLPQLTERTDTKKHATRKSQPDEPVFVKSSRPRGVTPTQPVSVSTPNFSSDQISDLEKELNGVVSSSKP